MKKTILIKWEGNLYMEDVKVDKSGKMPLKEKIRINQKYPRWEDMKYITVEEVNDESNDYKG